VLPLIVSRGSDQTPLTTTLGLAAGKANEAVLRNYGDLLAETAAAVPDGIVGFFPSMSYMQRAAAQWDRTGVLQRIMERKLLFFETEDSLETSKVLEAHRRACDAGRGAVLLASARGSVARQAHFENHYGRAVIIFGVPFQPVQSRGLRARLSFLRDRLGVQQGEFLTFDAVRQAARLVASAFGGKDDHTVAILADKRFNSARRRAKLPRWIARHIEPESLHLSTGMARAAAERYVRAMAQPADPVGESNDTAWLGPEDLALNGSVPLYQVKAKAAAEANSLAAAKLAAEAKAGTKPLKLKLKVTRVKKEPVATGDERTSVKREKMVKMEQPPAKKRRRKRR
jgi:DNA excision repair protein ERCC-2